MPPTVFNIPCQRLAISIQRFQMSPLIKGILTKQDSTNMGFPFLATVSASANDKIQKGGSLCQGWPRRIGLDQYRSPKCENHQEKLNSLLKSSKKRRCRRKYCDHCRQRRRLVYGIYLAINMQQFSSHEDRFAVFPNTFFLGHVDLSIPKRTIASKDLEKSRQRGPIAIRKWTENSTFLNPIIRLCKKQIALLVLVGNQIARPKLSC